MALARLDSVTFTYPGAARPALEDVSLELFAGEVVAVLGPSGSGKSTLVRALAGLVPHFHGGRFAGRVEVAGRDTRRTRPAELAGAVATVFQDPEDQVVMGVVENEVAFGVENIGVAPAQLWSRVEDALERVGAAHLRARRTTELSGGELQRVCLASALALEPQLLLLDEPTSQLDPAAAELFLAGIELGNAAAVLCEHRVSRALDVADRVVFMDAGRVLLDARTGEALRWLAAHRPAYLDADRAEIKPPATSGSVVKIDNSWFAYDDVPVLTGAALEVRRGEVVALEGPNGSGKTTLAKIAAGLLEPARGLVHRSGRAAYLSQDPGRYVVCETALGEASLAVGDASRGHTALGRVGLGWAADRHPRDLSSGERERLGLAAVSVGEPDLLVLDEPTRGLDPERKTEIGRWLLDYAAAGRGVLIATHDRTFPAHRRVSLAREEALVGA